MMKLFGHPWSINTRKVLAVIAEKGGSVPLELVMIPTGEHKRPAHVARHPFGKVPVLEHDGFVLYETRAINAYLDRVLAGPTRLVPEDAKGRARVDQWINVADSYFVPHAHVLVVEQLFRRYLGGERNEAAIAAARPALEPVLEVAEQALARSAYFAGEAFSLADVHWMPYVDYLVRIGESTPFEKRHNVWGWWQRVSARPAWQHVARTGPQPDEAGMTADVIETRYR